MAFVRQMVIVLTLLSTGGTSLTLFVSTAAEASLDPACFSEKIFVPARFYEEGYSFVAQDYDDFMQHWVQLAEVDYQRFARFYGADPGDTPNDIFEILTSLWREQPKPRKSESPGELISKIIRKRMKNAVRKSSARARTLKRGGRKFQGTFSATGKSVSGELRLVSDFDYLTDAERSYYGWTFVYDNVDDARKAAGAKKRNFIVLTSAARTKIRKRLGVDPNRLKAILGPDQQKILGLRFVGKSDQDISEALGISPQEVRVQMVILAKKVEYLLAFDIAEFAHTLPQEQAEVLLARLQGSSIRDLAQKMGVKQAVVLERQWKAISQLDYYLLREVAHLVDEDISWFQRFAQDLSPNQRTAFAYMLEGRTVDRLSEAIGASRDTALKANSDVGVRVRIKLGSDLDRFLAVLDPVERKAIAARIRGVEDDRLGTMLNVSREQVNEVVSNVEKKIGFVMQFDLNSFAAQLPDRDRRTFQSFLDGIPYENIGEASGVGAQAIGKDIARINKQLNAFIYHASSRHFGQTPSTAKALRILLSDSEVEVFMRKLSGKKNNLIAEELSLKPQSVKIKAGTIRKLLREGLGVDVDVLYLALSDEEKRFLILALRGDTEKSIAKNLGVPKERVSWLADRVNKIVQAVSNADDQKFLRGLDPSRRTILLMKRAGKTDKEIAAFLEQGPKKARAIINGIQEEYIKFILNSIE